MGGAERDGPEPRQWARHWRYARMPGLDLLRAHYVGHAFPRHTHDGYVLGAITAGIEAVGLPGRTVYAVPDDMVMINPEVPHTARAGVPEGFGYATLYPSVELVSEIAAETAGAGAPRGTAGFTRTLVRDPETVRLVTEMHRAAEQDDPLTADSLLRIVVARMLRRHGGPLPARTSRGAGARTAERARELLAQRMTDPPTLEALATELGTGPFALLRAFRDRYGMPPHTWLTDARVRRAGLLLTAGVPPSEVAAAVGFWDQSHLTRHFTRIVGVPPGAYQRERAAHLEPHLEPHGEQRARTSKTGGRPAD
jgi:AraC-like DNA-binding protein